MLTRSQHMRECYKLFLCKAFRVQAKSAYRLHTTFDETASRCQVLGRFDVVTPTQSKASRFDLWSVLILTSWVAVFIWSILFLPRLERLYESIQIWTIPVWSSWSIIAAKYCVLATPLLLWFLWSNPRPPKRSLYALPLAVTPVVVFLGAFVPWLQLHYIFES